MWHTLKTILVYLNGTARDLTVLATALQVGRLFDAHLDCLHVVPDRRSLIARATNVDLTEAMTLTDAFRALGTEAAKRVAHARTIFFAFCEDRHIPHADAPLNSLSVSAAWHEHVANPITVLIEEARFHDLVVLEGGARHDLILSDDDIGRLIVSAGRPVLLVPSALQGGSFKSIAIAWKNCPEAARAVMAAMPLLTRAESIVVLHADENGAQSAAEADDLDQFVDLLRRHGLHVEGRRVVPERLTIPDAVVGEAIEFSRRSPGHGWIRPQPPSGVCFWRLYPTRPRCRRPSGVSLPLERARPDDDAGDISSAFTASSDRWL